MRVFAAASLTDAFTALGAAFEAAHPGQRIQFNFAGSQALRLQIEHGAEADVFASADERHVRALQAAGTLRDPRVLARSELVLITPLDNPAGIERLADLPRAQRIVLGGEAVPIGRYARACLAHMGGEFTQRVLARVTSYENNVRLVRAKVELGAADAAFVYRADVTDRVRVVALPADARVAATWWTGAVGEGADAWLAFVARNPALLERHGFSRP